MTPPFPLHFDDYPRRGVDQIANDRDQFMSPINLDLGNGITVFFIDIGDSFNLALEVGEVLGGICF